MHSSRQMDPYQQVAIWVTALGIILELIYLLSVAIETKEYMSDGLFHTLWYRLGLSAFVVTSLVVCGLYFVQHHTEQRYLASAGCAFASGAIKSWLILTVFNYVDFPSVHNAAALSFVITSMLYTAVLLWMDFGSPPQEQLRDRRSWGLFAISFILVCTYIGLWVQQSEWTWLIEHIAFIFFQLSLLTFFWEHPFIQKKKENYATYSQFKGCGLVQYAIGAQLGGSV